MFVYKECVSRVFTMDHLPNLKICLAGICVYASGDCFKDLDVNDFGQASVEKQFGKKE